MSPNFPSPACIYVLQVIKTYVIFSTNFCVFPLDKNKVTTLGVDSITAQYIYEDGRENWTNLKRYESK
jgi:hypothetical protein